MEVSLCAGNALYIAGLRRGQSWWIQLFPAERFWAPRLRHAQPPLSMIVGTYAFGEREDERLSVIVRKGKLAIKRGEAASRYMIRVGPWEYHPTGAPAVRIRFERSGDKSVALNIRDAELSFQANRVAG